MKYYKGEFMKIFKVVKSNNEEKEITEKQLKEETGLSAKTILFVQHGCYEDCVNNIFYYCSR